LAKILGLSAATGLLYRQMSQGVKNNSPRFAAYCLAQSASTQSNPEEAKDDYVADLSSHSSVRYLLSQLRDKDTKTADFRFYSDRIMRLLLEEAIAREPLVKELRRSPTGTEYEHYAMKSKPEDYCAVTIIRAGDSMLGSIMELLPGISVGKVLI
jgi:uracil phosphoribosyltransferase